MDVPEIPLSYSLTGSIKMVTPIALMIPAAVSMRRLNGFSFLSKCFMGYSITK